MSQKSQYSNESILFENIKAARGETKADLVFKNIHFLDVFSGKFVSGDVALKGGTIIGILDEYAGHEEVDGSGKYLIPGFIDSHVHIESSLMSPRRFEQAVLPHGTTAVIWDPHEIANVKGTNGIDWALAATDGLALDVFVMVPSCVPATSPHMNLESSGATLNAEDLSPYKAHPRVLGLAEMMNFPGLLFGDDDVLAKLVDFNGMLRDGHCPGLGGKDLNAYAVAGIHSCHESISLEEAEEKLTKGIHVLIREGSCAKNAKTLLPLLNDRNALTLGLCSDDRNPYDIAKEGHISFIVNTALRAGHSPENVFRAASYAPARIYGLGERGAIAPGYMADLCLVEPINASFQNGIEIKSVFKSGRSIDTIDFSESDKRQEFKSAFGSQKNMNMDLVKPDDFIIAKPQNAATDTQFKANVIEVVADQIVTKAIKSDIAFQNEAAEIDCDQDLLKIAVLERHHNSGNKAIAFVSGFGLKKGAIATSINHDSHNVITVGTSDQAMAACVNRLIEIDGGIVVYDEQGFVELPLPIGGLMTDEAPEQVTKSLGDLKKAARQLGCSLEEPFLQLSFLALPVIPTLKITDKGLVDVNQFKIINVIEPS